MKHTDFPVGTRLQLIWHINPDARHLNLDRLVVQSAPACVVCDIIKDVPATDYDNLQDWEIPIEVAVQLRKNVEFVTVHIDSSHLPVNKVRDAGDNIYELVVNHPKTDEIVVVAKYLRK